MGKREDFDQLLSKVIDVSKRYGGDEGSVEGMFDKQDAVKESDPNRSLRPNNGVAESDLGDSSRLSEKVDKISRLNDNNLESKGK